MTDLPTLKDLREKIRRKIFKWGIEEGGDKLHFNDIVDEIFVGFAKIIKAHAAAYQKKIEYLTEKESKMPVDLALMQVILGLQSKTLTKGDAVEIIGDAYNLGARDAVLALAGLTTKGVMK